MSSLDRFTSVLVIAFLGTSPFSDNSISLNQCAGHGHQVVHAHTLGNGRDDDDDPLSATGVDSVGDVESASGACSAAGSANLIFLSCPVLHQRADVTFCRVRL